MCVAVEYDTQNYTFSINVLNYSRENRFVEENISFR